MARRGVNRIEQSLWKGYDWFRSSDAHNVIVGDDTDLECLRGHKHALLVTFRRDGTAVPAPMWFGLRDGKAYMRTGAESWKVKRIVANPYVLIAPATARGRPLGCGIQALARILPREEHPLAIETRISNYGLGRWAYDHTIAHVYGAATYLEVSAIGAQVGSV